MSPRTKNLLILVVGGFVGLMALGFVAGVAAGFWSAHTGESRDTVTFWALGAFAVIAMAGGMVISVKWMRSIDEAAREAHKAAWFWGGTAGMSLGGVGVILSSLPQAEKLAFPSWFDGRTDPAAYAATGAFAMLCLMIIGYAIVWAWWWWARR